MVAAPPSSSTDQMVKELADAGMSDAKNIQFWLTQQDIASRVGASREMISRIFKELTAGGYLSVQRDRVLIYRKPPARW